ncbi:MAG TPA: transglutaminaseTgpA domain-containing protein [Pantanalinema sp.]
MRLRIALSGRGAAVLAIGGLCLLTGGALGMPLLNLSGDALLVLLVLASILGILELRGVTLDVRLGAEAEQDGSWIVGVRAHARRQAGPFGLALKAGKSWRPDVPLSVPEASSLRLNLPPAAGRDPVRVRLRTFPLGLLAVCSIVRVPRPEPGVRADDAPGPDDRPAPPDLSAAPFGGIREHRVGEGIRDVHWGASARLQRLVVRLREAERDRSPARSALRPPASGRAPRADLLLLHAASASAVLGAIAFSGLSGLVPPAIAGIAGTIAMAGSALSARRQGRPGRWLHAVLYFGMLGVLAGFLWKLQRPGDSHTAMVELVVLVMGLFAWDLRNRAYLGAQQLFALLTVAVLPAFAPVRDTPWVGLSYGLALLSLVLASWADGRHSIGYARVRLKDLEALPSRWVPLALIGLVAYLAQPWLPAIPLPELPTFGLAPAQAAKPSDEATRHPGQAGGLSLNARWPTSDAAVIRLEGPEPVRLRVETFDTYRAGRWSRSDLKTTRRPSVSTLPSHRWLTLLFPDVTHLPLPETTVGVLTPMERPLLRQDGSLANPTGLRRGYRYRVALGEEPGWRRGAPSRAQKALDGQPADFARLAHEFAAGAGTPADALNLLERRIRRAARYDLEAPRPPAGEDPTLFFLTASHRGYCAHYASALALLGRSLGIATRLVVGYAPPERAGDGVTYRAGDAHAWVEAFIDGRWESYDPTPMANERPSRGADPRLLMLAGVLLALCAYPLIKQRRSGPAAEYRRALRGLRRRGVSITRATSAQEALRLASRTLDESEIEALAALIRRYDAQRFAPRQRP